MKKRASLTLISEMKPQELTTIMWSDILQSLVMLIFTFNLRQPCEVLSAAGVESMQVLMEDKG